jgi:hypothetical protein
MNESATRQEVRNERAPLVYNRVQRKLTGTYSRGPMSFKLITVQQDRDFNPDNVLTVPEQVDKLILQATSVENRQCFSRRYVTSQSSYSLRTDSPIIAQGVCHALFEHLISLFIMSLMALSGLASSQ